MPYIWMSCAMVRYLSLNAIHDLSWISIVKMLITMSMLWGGTLDSLFQGRWAEGLSRIGCLNRLFSPECFHVSMKWIRCEEEQYETVDSLIVLLYERATRVSLQALFSKETSQQPTDSHQWLRILNQWLRGVADSRSSRVLNSFITLSNTFTVFGAKLTFTYRTFTSERGVLINFGHWGPVVWLPGLERLVMELSCMC